MWTRADEEAAASDADWLTDGDEADEGEEEAKAEDQEGSDDDDKYDEDGNRVAAGPPLLWSGALDVQLPSLGPGESHEHVLTVGCGQRGVYRLAAQVLCAAADGGVETAGNSFVDMEVP